MSKIFFLIIISLFTNSEIFSQVACDCDIFPVKSDCKEKCGIKILQKGSEDELVQKLKIKKETAKRIVNTPQRSKKTKVEDFQEDLPMKYYKDLEDNFKRYISVDVVQINQNGKNNVYLNGDNSGDIKVGDTYNRPLQRHLEPIDLQKIFEKVKSKSTKIKVTSNGSLEGEQFKNEIMIELKKSGYKNIVDKVVPFSQKFFNNERLTIRPDRYQNDEWIEVIINPQE
jgi:hypothetical protein